MSNIFGKYITAVAYLLICFIISIPFNYANFQLLYTEDAVPAGADITHHTYSILKILETNNPLISYTAYPTLVQNVSSFYPSLMHLTIASIAKISSVNDTSTNDPIFVLEIVKSFMFAVSLAGTAGYAIFIRTIINKLIAHRINQSFHSSGDPIYSITFLVISVLAFGIFIYSVSPIIKTYNDGTYAEITAMWSVFPYYLYFLANQRWILSAILLAIIASIHNLSFLMSLSATLPFIASLLLQRIKGLKKNLVKFIVIFLILGAPALIFFYLPSAAAVLSGSPGESFYTSWSQRMVIEQLTPGLYYAGIIAIILALILNYRILGWLAGWALIYFLVFSFSSVLGERFARELSVVFGLVIGICVAYVLLMTVLTGKRWLHRGNIGMNSILVDSGKFALIIGISAAIASTSYLYFQDRLHAESNPNVSKYFTDTVGKSNKYFLELPNEENASSSANDKRVITLFGLNPWLKVTTYGKFDVLSVSAPAGAQSLGKIDKQINQELHQIIDSPDVRSTSCIIKKYDIDYVYIADRIAGRFYSPFQGEEYYRQLSQFQSFTYSPFFHLSKEFFGEEGEYIRIYSINNNNVKQVCP